MRVRALAGREPEMSKTNVTINGIEYMPVSECPAINTTGDYVIVRTYSAGVFAGQLQTRNGKEVVLTNARRLWRWGGAASLSQMAMEGTSKPDDCKFPCAVAEVVLTEAIEILIVTDFAKKSIQSVPVWSA